MTNYNERSALVLSNLMALILEDNSPTTINECMADEMLFKLATGRFRANGESLNTNPFEQCVYDIAEASEQLANALVNYHALVSKDK